MIIERRLVEIDLEKKKEKGPGREKTIVFDPRPRNGRRKWDSRGEGGGKLRKLARETLERVGRPIVQFRHSLPVLVTRSYIPVVIISTDRRCDLCLPPEGRKKCCATRRRQGFVAFPGKRFPCKRGTCVGRARARQADPLLLITYQRSCAERNSLHRLRSRLRRLIVPSN